MTATFQLIKFFNLPFSLGVIELGTINGNNAVPYLSITGELNKVIQHQFGFTHDILIENKPTYFGSSPNSKLDLIMNNLQYLIYGDINTPVDKTIN